MIGATLDAVGSVSLLAQSTSLATSRRQAAHLTMLVDRVDNPVDARIITNLLVRWVNKNHFIVLLGSVLIDPVTIQDTKVAVLTANLFFRNTLQITFKLQLIDTLVLGLSEHHT